MNLYICEKPSQGRDLAKVLHCNNRQEGALTNGSETVTWCLGHLLELQEPHEYDPKYKYWRIEDLPIIPQSYKYKVKSASAKQYKVVSDLIKKADCVFIATDFDREGEAIARTILERTRYKGPIKRVCLSALDELSIKRALANTRDGSQTVSMYYSAQSRLRADWVVGLNLSRLFTLLARQNGFNASVPVGRVLTPTVALVVARDLEIRNFVPVPYYDLSINVQTEKGNFKAQWLVPENQADDQGRCLNKEFAEHIANLVKNQTAVILSAEKKSVKESAPLPFDLTSLQQYASKKWGYTAQQTLDAAQNLYENHKATTYPRTDCRYLPDSQRNDVSHIFNALVSADPSINNIISTTNIHRKTRCFKSDIDSAHHAIIPTMKPANLSAMNDIERNIYNAVRAFYICQFIDDAEFLKTTITVFCSDQKFVAKGKIVVNQGYRKILSELGLLNSLNDEENSEQQESNNLLPDVKTNDPCVINDTDVIGKETTPPAHFTEATLLSAMENVGRYVQEEKFKKILKETAGIGTPATRAGIIENSIRHEYLERNKKSILATEKAIAVIERLPNGMKSAGLTAAWEQELEKIASNTESADNFMLNIEKWVRSMIANYLAKNTFIINADVVQQYSKPKATNVKDEKATSNRSRSKTKSSPRKSNAVKQNSTQHYANTLGQNENTIVCPKCGKPMVLRTNRVKGNKFYGCSGFPLCRETKQVD